MAVAHLLLYIGVRHGQRRNRNENRSTTSTRILLTQKKKNTEAKVPI